MSNDVYGGLQDFLKPAMLIRAPPTGGRNIRRWTQHSAFMALQPMSTVQTYAQVLGIMSMPMAGTTSAHRTTGTPPAADRKGTSLSVTQQFGHPGVRLAFVFVVDRGDLRVARLGVER